MAITVKKSPSPKKSKKPEVESEVYPLQLIAMGDIRVAPGNAKEHSDEQIDAIIRSIQKFGFRDPLALTGDMEIVEGHGRFLALKKMGAKEVPAMIFPDMTPEEVRAYRIAHNQLTISTGFDLDLLVPELHQIQDFGLLDLTGFSGMDLEQMELDLEGLEEEPELESGGGNEMSDFDGESEEEGSEGFEKEGGSEVLQVYQYVLLFDNKEQKEAWMKFLTFLKQSVEGETISERLVSFALNSMPEVGQ